MDHHKRDLSASVNYFFDAASFRFTLDQNVRDFVFAHEQHGRIVYVFDANIIGFFLDPVAEAEHIAIFSAATSFRGTAPGRRSNWTGEERKERTAWRAAALITAEFLFSGHLAGQWGDMPYISDAHAEDTDQLYQRTLAPFEAMLADSGDNHGFVDEATGDEMVKLTGRLNNLFGDLQKMRHLEKPEVLDGVANKATKYASLCCDLFDAKKNPLVRVLALLRLTKEDLIAPLAVDPLMTPDILEPSGERLDDLAKRIREVAPDKGSDNIRRDAETLEQVLRLNDASADLPRPTRYVLMTTDLHLYHAFALWYWNNQDSGQPFFALRHPSQYLPLLNVTEMPNKIRNESLIRHAEDTLDSYLENFRRWVHPYPQSLSYYAFRPRHDRVAQPKFQSMDTWQHSLAAIYPPEKFEIKGGKRIIAALIKEWRQALETTILMNPQLLTRRIEGTFGDLQAAPDPVKHVRDVLEHAFEDRLGRLRRLHIGLGLRYNLRILHELRSDVGKGRPARGPLALRTDFSGFIGDRTVDEFASSLTSRKMDDFFQRFEKQLQDSRSYKAPLLAAIIAFRCSAWEISRRYSNLASRRVIDRIGMEDDAELLHDAKELQFFMAVTTRFVLMQREELGKKWEEDFKAARSWLSSSEHGCRHVQDHDGELRAISEHAAVELVAAYQRALLTTDEGWNRRMNAFGRAVEFLNKARKLIESDVCDFGSDMISRVGLQVEANTISAGLFAILFGSGATSQLPEDRLRGALSAIESEIANQSSSISTHTRLEARLMRLELGSEGDRDEQVEMFRREYSQLTDAEDEIFAQRLTHLDREMLKKFNERIDAIADKKRPDGVVT